MAKRRRRKLKKKAVNRLICLLVLIITAFVLVTKKNGAVLYSDEFDNISKVESVALKVPVPSPASPDIL